MTRPELNHSFQSHLEAATGHTFVECCLTNTAMSIVATDEAAIDAAVALRIGVRGKQYDPQFKAWFAEIPVQEATPCH